MTYDFVIIGSGFGGSVSALRLVEKGYRVLLLEKGRRFGAKDFPRTNWELRRWMWMPRFGLRGMFKMSFFPHLTVVHGVGYGGGSLVYANTLPVPKATFFTSGTWSGLADWKTELAEPYATAQQMLGATRNPSLSYADEVVREVARDIGRPHDFQPTEVAVYFGEPGRTVADPYFGGRGPDRTGCIGCGGCMTGCRFNAKNTLDKNYLYLAESLGLEVATETEVTAVRPAEGGYHVEARGGRVILARNVVFAGGVLGSLELLLRMKADPQGLPRLSDRLGEFVRTNSESLIEVVSERRDHDLSKGIAIGSILETDDHSHLEPTRYGAGSGFFRLLAAPHVAGASFWTRMANLVSTVVRHPLKVLRAVLVPDFARYSIILLYMRALEGSLRMKMGRGITTGFATGLTTELGEGPAPTASMPEATDLARRVAEKIQGFPVSLVTETALGVPTTAHILGGCCMGATAEEGVIDRNHKVFGYEGLFVIDGSAVSANPGVNPSLTITALAERAMSRIPPLSRTVAQSPDPLAGDGPGGRHPPSLARGRRRIVSPLALLPLLAALAVSCRKDAPPGPHAASESPVAAPATLIAEGTLRDPDAFWGRLRQGGGAATTRAAETAAGAILAWASVDPALAPLLSGKVPFYVALGDSPDGIAFAIAMKLSNLEAVRGALVEGDTARFRAREIEGMIRLLPSQGEAPGLALAVSWSGYLVIASSASELAGLGAYAARTLPTRPLPSSSFELRVQPAALERVAKKAPEFATAAIAGWARGALPPQADAGAFAVCFAPGMRDAAGMASDLAEIRVDADAADSRLDAVATLVPKPGDSAARQRLRAMHPADAAPLLDAPREAIAALFWSDAAEVRAEGTGSLGSCLGRVLAPLLGAGGGPKLGELAASWARGRGDWETASFVVRPSVAGLVVRAPVADGPAVSASLRGLADLVSRPSFADAIRRLLPLRAEGVQAIEVPRVGKGSLAMFPPRPPSSREGADLSDASAELAPPGLAWAVDTKEVDVGLGQSPRDLLALTRSAAPLRMTASIERAVRELGANVTFAAVVVPPGCCSASGPAAAPLTLAWGSHDGNGRVNLSLGDELLARIVAQVSEP
jgi:cholesterol oxidase